MRQFMVRILRDNAHDFADVVVDATDEGHAKDLALGLVKANPDLYFGDRDDPRYFVDRASDVEDVTGGEYASNNAEAGEKQYMVRILRDTDEDYADVVVNADDEEVAKGRALALVNARPSLYFGDCDDPRYYADPASDVEDVTGGEFASANRCVAA